MCFVFAVEGKMPVFVLIQKSLLCASGKGVEVSFSGKRNCYIFELLSYVFHMSSKVIRILEKSNSISKLLTAHMSHRGTS